MCSSCKVICSTFGYANFLKDDLSFKKSQVQSIDYMYGVTRCGLCAAKECKTTPGSDVALLIREHIWRLVKHALWLQTWMIKCLRYWFDCIMLFSSNLYIGHYRILYSVTTSSRLLCVRPWITSDLLLLFITDDEVASAYLKYLRLLTKPKTETKTGCCNCRLTSRHLVMLFMLVYTVGRGHQLCVIESYFLDTD